MKRILTPKERYELTEAHPENKRGYSYQTEKSYNFNSKEPN